MSRQYVYDRIKRMREEGEAWLTFKGRRIRIIPPLDPKHCSVCYWGNLTQHGALVKCRRSIGIARVQMWIKDAEPHRYGVCGLYRAGYVSAREIIAIIVEDHPALSTSNAC